MRRRKGKKGRNVVRLGVLDVLWACVAAKVVAFVACAVQWCHVCCSVRCRV